jgi:hypothetical protein
MTYFADLTPYSYMRALPPGTEGDPELSTEGLNVGWLEPGHSYPTGEVPDAAVAGVLRRVISHRVNVMRGWHDCGLCPWPENSDPAVYPEPTEMEVDGTAVFLGHCEIRVRDEAGVLYAAPSLVAHYMGEHHYLPPAGFLEAVTP